MTKSTPLDAAFIESQKRKLLQLKKDLTTASRDSQQETTGATQALSAQAHEREDDAQHLTAYELNGQLGEFVDRRVSAIDRALAKIEAGTYGISEQSGKAIALERLKALPEAAVTQQEQQALDAKG
jgi:DnaK suppressor protein